MKKTILLLLVFNICCGQSSIVSGGDSNITIGETFPVMRVDMKPKEVRLGVPKFEQPPEPKPVPVSKKKSFIQKLMDFINKLINKQK